MFSYFVETLLLGVFDSTSPCLDIRWNTSSCVWCITILGLGNRHFLLDETLFIFSLLLSISDETQPLYGYLRRNRSSDYLRLKRRSHCHSSHLVRWRQWKLSKNVLLTHLEFLLRLLTGCFFNFLVSVVCVVVLRSLVALPRKIILDMRRLCLKNGRFDAEGVLPYKGLIGMCRWMGSHFHDWID